MIEGVRLTVKELSVFLRSLFFIHFIISIQFVHPVYINKNEGDKNINCALLGKPKAEFETADLNGIKLVGEEDAAAKRNEEPDAEKDVRIAEVAPPIGLVLGR